MDEFQKIIEEAIEKANNVDCSIEDFIEGLVVMIGELEICKEASKSDLGG